MSTPLRPVVSGSALPAGHAAQQGPGQGQRQQRRHCGCRREVTARGHVSDAKGARRESEKRERNQQQHEQQRDVPVGEDVEGEKPAQYDGAAEPTGAREAEEGQHGQRHELDREQVEVLQRLVEVLREVGVDDARECPHAARARHVARQQVRAEARSHSPSRMQKPYAAPGPTSSVTGSATIMLNGECVWNTSGMPAGWKR